MAAQASRHRAGAIALSENIFCGVDFFFFLDLMIDLIDLNQS